MTIHTSLIKEMAYQRKLEGEIMNTEKDVLFNAVGIFLDMFLFKKYSEELVSYVTDVHSDPGMDKEWEDIYDKYAKNSFITEKESFNAMYELTCEYSKELQYCELKKFIDELYFNLPRRTSYLILWKKAIIQSKKELLEKGE